MEKKKKKIRGWKNSIHDSFIIYQIDTKIINELPYLMAKPFCADTKKKFRAGRLTKLLKSFLCTLLHPSVHHHPKKGLNKQTAVNFALVELEFARTL
jgi:hypothetical protein